MPSVGAYIASVDGDRLEGARKLARRSARSGSTRRCGRWPTPGNSPTWRCSSRPGEVDGYIYLGQQTPAFYAKQVIASLLMYGQDAAAAVLRRADGL